MEQTSPPGGPGARCARCGAPFECGMAAGSPPCWCGTLPSLRRLPEDLQGCLCPSCLRELLAHQEVAGGAGC